MYHSFRFLLFIALSLAEINLSISALASCKNVSLFWSFSNCFFLLFISFQIEIMVNSKFLSLKDKKKLCLSVLLLEDDRKKKHKRETWIRSWLLRRKQQGCYHNLMQELALEVSIFSLFLN